MVSASDPRLFLDSVQRRPRVEGPLATDLSPRKSRADRAVAPPTARRSARNRAQLPRSDRARFARPPGERRLRWREMFADLLREYYRRAG